MFCPKCGSQNVDKSKFCRGCGADVVDVTALVADKQAKSPMSLAEKAIALNSRGIRGVLGGVGFLFVAAVIWSRPPYDGIFWLLPLTLAFVWLSTGISRFVQAHGLKALAMQNEPVVLPPGQMDYIKPQRSIYDTDDLIPASVTEHTTTNLSQK